MKLVSCYKNIYSQFGEDGIIEKIFEIIGPKSKLCIEFGAWDGYHFSNTANLWANKGWTGILIEGDKDKAAQLTKNIYGYKCLALCRYVGLTQGNTLEDILKKHDITESIDLLSIDIDGDEYHILSTLKNIRPRIIICEYNPTIPYWLDIYSPPGTQIGSSISALMRIGREKGYRLIAVTDTNCFFVLEEEYSKFKIFNTNIDDISNSKHLNYIITSYSGSYFIYGQFPFGITTKNISEVKADKEIMNNLSNNLCLNL